MKEKGEMTMCKIWDYVEAQGMEKGIAQGMEKGREELKELTALEMLRHGEPDEKIMQYLKLSLKEINHLRKKNGRG